MIFAFPQSEFVSVRTKSLMFQMPRDDTWQGSALGHYMLILVQSLLEPLAVEPHVVMGFTCLYVLGSIVLRVIFSIPLSTAFHLKLISKRN